ncbi:hypothetical protein EMCRGX_G010551 [Ephydatia muelleri]
MELEKGMYPAQSGAYPSHPVPAQPMHPSPPSYPQATSQQESNTVVVVQRQPTVTTTVITPVGDYYYTASIVLTFICLFCGSWWSLCCTIPAIFMASSARDAAARGDLARASHYGQTALGLNICAVFFYIVAVAVFIGVFVSSQRLVCSNTYYTYRYSCS